MKKILYSISALTLLISVFYYFWSIGIINVDFMGRTGLKKEIAREIRAKKRIYENTDHLVEQLDWKRYGIMDSGVERMSLLLPTFMTDWFSSSFCDQLEFRNGVILCEENDYNQFISFHGEVESVSEVKKIGMIFHFSGGSDIKNYKNFNFKEVGRVGEEIQFGNSKAIFRGLNEKEIEESNFPNVKERIWFVSSKVSGDVYFYEKRTAKSNPEKVEFISYKNSELLQKIFGSFEFPKE